MFSYKEKCMYRESCLRRCSRMCVLRDSTFIHISLTYLLASYVNRMLPFTLCSFNKQINYLFLSSYSGVNIFPSFFFFYCNSLFPCFFCSYNLYRKPTQCLTIFYFKKQVQIPTESAD